MSKNLTISPGKTHFALEDTSSGYCELLLPVDTTLVYREENGIRLEGKEKSFQLKLGHGHKVRGQTVTTSNDMMAEVIQLLVL